MVNVFLKKNLTQYVALEITGHAMSGEFGHDIVCAAVSVLGQTLANSLEELAGISEEDMSLKYDSGILSISLPNDVDRKVVDILFRNFEIGIEGIIGGYPEYVKLIIEEVQDYDKSF